MSGYHPDFIAKLTAQQDSATEQYSAPRYVFGRLDCVSTATAVNDVFQQVDQNRMLTALLAMCQLVIAIEFISFGCWGLIDSNGDLIIRVRNSKS